MADAGGLVYLLEVDMGTRETPQDIEAREKKEARKRKGKNSDYRSDRVKAVEVRMTNG